jgi:uncharacterized membrane protein YecN with MAPEG domain
MPFDADQKSIRNGALLALLVTVLTYACCLAFNISFAEFGDLTSAAPTLAASFALLAISLAGTIAGLANHRFFEPLDRHAAAGETATHKARQYQAVLTNTLEQVVLATLIYLVAAVALPKDWSDCIISAALLFASGRIFFALGYAKGAGARAFGFGLTFYPTVLLGLLSLIAALR